jgi:hypothetical protein
MSSAWSWRNDFEASFRRRNAVHESFRSVVSAQQLLTRQNAALRQQKESAEKQLLILQHEHVGSAGSEVVRQLEARVRSLQEELLAKAAAEAAGADAKYRLLAAETSLGDTTRALEALKGSHAEAVAEAARLTGSEAVLRKEVRSVWWPCSEWRCEEWGVAVPRKEVGSGGWPCCEFR